MHKLLISRYGLRTKGQYHPEIYVLTLGRRRIHFLQYVEWKHKIVHVEECMYWAAKE